MPDLLAAGCQNSRVHANGGSATLPRCGGIGRSTLTMGEGPVIGLLGFRQRPLHGWLRRLRFALQRWFTNRPTGTQRIYRVDVDGRTAKRIVFPDSYEAARVARSLQVFGPSGIVPAVLLQRERDLWLEFDEGQPLNELDSLDEITLERLVEVFATLYSREPRLVALDRTSFAHALSTDLEFLRDVGVLSSGVRGLLAEFTERKAPKEVWVGYDCTDAILKNFVREPSGRVRLIDAETVAAGQKEEIQAVSAVLPFRVNSYVLDELIDWDAVPDDPMFQLTFPQGEMLAQGDLDRMLDLVRSDAPADQVKLTAQAIQRKLNPHPSGQVELNVPSYGGEPLRGLQHKYPETVLFFPAQGQTAVLAVIGLSFSDLFVERG